MLPWRSNSCLAKKDDGTFIAIEDKAVRCRAIKESLEASLEGVRKHIKGRKILKRKNPLGALDLSHLAKAAGLSCLIAMPWRSLLPPPVPYEEQR